MLSSSTSLWKPRLHSGGRLELAEDENYTAKGMRHGRHTYVEGWSGGGDRRHFFTSTASPQCPQGWSTRQVHLSPFHHLRLIASHSPAYWGRAVGRGAGSTTYTVFFYNCSNADVFARSVLSLIPPISCASPIAFPRETPNSADISWTREGRERNESWCNHGCSRVFFCGLLWQTLLSFFEVTLKRYPVGKLESFSYCQ